MGPRSRLSLAVLCAVAFLIPSGSAQAQTVVSLTFDDGIQSQYVEAVPRLAAHSMPGTFFINSGNVGTDSYYMSWSQINQVSGAGHEIGGHTIDHVKLTDPGVNVRHEICDDAAALRSRGYAVVDFAYPFSAGSTNGAIRQTLADCGYISARKFGDLRGPDCPSVGCSVAETIPPVDPYGINSLGTQRNAITQVDSPLTLSQLMTSVTQAEEVGGWLPLVFHDVCTCPATPDSVSPSDFEAFLDWLQPQAANGTVVRTVRSVMEPPHNPSPPPLPTVVTADKVTAFASLSVRRVQDIDKLYVKASMGEAGTLTARARVSVPNASRTYRFRTAKRTARPGAVVKLRLRLAKKALRVAKRALRRHKRLRARITITARDAAGNLKAAKRTVRLRR